MYLCFVDAGRTDRHLSLVPHFAGSEAICGQRIASSERVSWEAAMHMVTCRDCRAVGVTFRRYVATG